MKNKIKVLYIVSTLRRCGPTNQLLYIVSNLDRAIYDAKIITLSKESNETLKPLFLEENIKIETLGLSRVSGIFLGYRRLKQMVNSYSPNIIHTQGIRADSFSKKLMKFDIKTIATIRCIPAEDYKMKYGRVLGGVMAKLHVKRLRQLDIVVSVSNAVRDSLVSYGLPTITIQNGVDTEKFSLIEKDEKKCLRSKLGLAEGKIIIISVGHLSNRKDPLTIIKAFKELKNKNSFELIFVGDGELREECEKEIKGYSNIRLIGRVENVNDYLNASDIFISASLSEGLPNTVLESLSCNIPTILSDIPQHLEILRVSNLDFPSFKIGDVDGLRNIIDNLTIQDIELLSSRSSVQRHFDAKITSNKYQKVYLNLLD